MVNLAALPERGVIVVEGEDRVSFLQGLVSNDVTAVKPGGDGPGEAVWAALLTPQGKWLADFFILTDGERLLLDVEAEQAAMLVQRLSRFRLRAKVTVRVDESLHVFVAWGGVPDMVGLIARDPRLPDAGWRILSVDPLPTTTDGAAWNRHRLSLGLPDGSRDLEADKSVLLEAGFDELSGVSWTKGCYMGQELTARTKYRGLLKRRLIPVEVDGDLPPWGAPVLRGDGQEVGTMRSGVGRTALAALRLDALSAPMTANGVTITPRIPDWMKLPD